MYLIGTRHSESVSQCSMEAARCKAPKGKARHKRASFEIVLAGDKEVTMHAFAEH